MDKEHYIEWLAMIAGEKICKIKLYPEQNAECRFKYIPGSKYMLIATNMDYGLQKLNNME